MSKRATSPKKKSPVCSLCPCLTREGKKCRNRVCDAGPYCRMHKNCGGGVSKSPTPVQRAKKSPKKAVSWPKSGVVTGVHAFERADAASGKKKSAKTCPRASLEPSHVVEERLARRDASRGRECVEYLCQENLHDQESYNAYFDQMEREKDQDLQAIQRLESSPGDHQKKIHKKKLHFQFLQDKQSYLLGCAARGKFCPN